MTKAEKLIRENQLTQNSHLDLSYCGLRGNEPELQKLKGFTWLEELALNDNQIEDISFLSGLTRLKHLHLYDNQIQDTAPLQHLTNLKYLDLSNNKTQDITPLQRLTSLTFLALNDNLIHDIAPLQQLKSLTYLYLDNNQIQDIIPLQYLTNLTTLYFYKNSFLTKLPYEIKAKSNLEILQYWIDLHKAQKIREGKVVFVGEGGSGKTSLMHSLLYGRQDETTRTEKIEIHINDTLFTYGENKEALKLRFWDFGGQDIMHATHKFFMSSRTLYVLVVHGRKDEGETLQNWVEMLRSSIEDSPVLLVVNHLDEPKDKHRLPDAELKREFPNLVLPVIETSWKTQRGINDLQTAIQNALQAMPHFEEDFPVIYQSIKERLEAIKAPYIDYNRYKGICQDIAQAEEATFETTSQRLLADILNDLGIMLNFRKKHDQLKDLLIFKPEWIVNGVYQIINAGETQASKGRIQESTAFELLAGKGYEEARESGFILEMMNRFKLAYRQDSVGKCLYLIPSLFDVNRPEAMKQAWQETDTLKVRFQYDIWRNDYISYFLVSQHAHIAGELYWKNGAILDYGKQRVHIEAMRTKRSIEIEVAGKQDKRYALWRVREALAQVHAMFDEAKLGIELYVVHQEAGKEDEFEYEYLKQAHEDGETHIYSKVFRKKLSISALLDEVSLKKSEIPKVIQNALACIDKAKIAGYFEEMDKLDLPTEAKYDYARLKNEHINGNTGFEFAGRLRTFAQSI